MICITCIFTRCYKLTFNLYNLREERKQKKERRTVHPRKRDENILFSFIVFLRVLKIMSYVVDMLHCNSISHVNPYFSLTFHFIYLLILFFFFLNTEEERYDVYVHKTTRSINHSR